MGKAKKPTKGAEKSTPKCSCEHPYTCSCGNRPPRPSKGHKWDPEKQEWGGKGHKQKGASGQIASVAQQAKTTEVGKTKVAQWQRLPTQLLLDVCKTQKRQPPKYKNLESKEGSYKYRVIVPDQKDSEKDLFFVPAVPVANEEQAKEESALLALLHLTPNLPHERKLPDPYRETWLHAIEQSKKAAKVTAPVQKPMVKDGKADNVGSTAKASTNLTMANTFTSQAQKRQQEEEQRRQRNDRIRRHEAIRMANQNHPVFMSAKIREEIRRILRGEVVNIDEGMDDDAEEPVSGDVSEVQAYVEERLHNEGFTKRQARTAFNEVGVSSNVADESQWDNIYEKSLQWLLLHLDEDQLPVGFDPRGGTLDVIANSTLSGDSDSMDFAKRFGLTALDARKVLAKAKSESISREDALWLCAQDVAKVSSLSEAMYSTSDNDEVLHEEIAALEAIFASDFTFKTVDDDLILDIHLSEYLLHLEVVVHKRGYPYSRPRRILVSGHWTRMFGADLLVELIRFTSDLPLGEPMIFEIQNHLLQILQDPPEAAAVTFATPSPSLNGLPHMGTNDQPSASGRSKVQVCKKRPRERYPFWSTVPEQTPAAVAFPKIDITLKKARESLPAFSARAEFLATMQKAQCTGRVLLVTGETGCGKTTQIPQFILEESPAHAKIVVAQPRRLAATGVASRVAIERGEERPGCGSVGYVVRGDTALSTSCRLVFCTTGVLLRQLQNDRALDCITHIVVDEVHERHLDTDILLGLLKNILPMQKNLRVILMSATLAADRFVAYWGDSTPTMHIPGRTFPVKDYMLEDVLALTGYLPPKRKWKKENKSLPNQASNSAVEGDEESDGEPGDNRSEGKNQLQEVVGRMDETIIDYDLLASLVKHLILNKQAADDGSILVFLPGAPEINAAMAAVKKVTKELPVWLLELHGGLQPKDQNLVFRRAEKGFTKVILSTNIAETSVTIPDCSIVIDSAREKQSSYDPSNRMPLLLETFASKASLKQRRGRAGRVREGTCYKLISSGTYQTLQEHSDPEICRCALDQTLLSLLFLGVETGSGAFLRTLLDPPSTASIFSATYSLEKIGAINKKDFSDGLCLTPLGLHLAGIPAPPAVGKMLVMGSILSCRDAALAMAASMSLSRSPFLKIELPRHHDSDMDSQIMRMKQTQILEERSKLLQTVGNSDHAMIAAIFNTWRSKGTNAGQRKQYCDSMGLSFNGMRDMLQLVMQLDSALSAVGFLPSAEANRNSTSWRIIRCCAVAALSPTQLVKLIRPAEKYQDTAEGVVQKNTQAKENRFFVRVGTESSTSDNTDYSEERVFIHPTSAIFTTGSFSCPWLVYHSLVRTSKPFLRDATECTAYSLLLFGGSIAVQASKGVIVIDDWAQLSANATIGTLVGKLREKIDELLEKKISDATFDLAGTREMKLICKLIRSDGLGNQ